MIDLDPCQIDAVRQMHNGCVLCGGVGSGKSRTALAYYYISEGGKLEDEILPTDHPRDLIIITTPKKRDSFEWDGEMLIFGMSTDPDCDFYEHEVIVDSWNNIQKYVNRQGCFFLFDEQRASGSGPWSKAFVKIAKRNHWILLSATPGDKWEDYIPLFLANGFYRTKGQFQARHCIFSPYTDFPQIIGWMHEDELIAYRDSLLVTIDWQNPAERHDIDIWVDYDEREFRRMMRERCGLDEEPFVNAAQLCYELRKVSNSHPSRLRAVIDVVRERERIIVFYSFDYELDILKSVEYRTASGEICEVAEWNGHKHEEIPEGDCWVYLVNYGSGAEGWNCIRTNTILFYSQTYSYKTLEQARGRIDRRTTPYNDLYFYHLKTHSKIDVAIQRALNNKKKFNENKFVKW